MLQAPPNTRIIWASNLKAAYYQRVHVPIGAMPHGRPRDLTLIVQIVLSTLPHTVCKDADILL